MPAVTLLALDAPVPAAPRRPKPRRCARTGVPSLGAQTDGVAPGENRSARTG